ncbi:hypothetical protein [Citreimonas sp.]|uniref:hypothetical protein n=1 Tax=Citreimonas sp. TaxID=3036715 RepID=UPI00405986EA
MTWSFDAFAGLAARAATAAGFPHDRAQTFGRAAAVHMARGGDSGAIAEALRDPADSPILRLPLLMHDLMRAAQISGPSVALSVLPADRALAPDYAELLPVTLRDVTIRSATEKGPAQLQATVTEDVAEEPDATGIDVPDDLVETLSRLAEREQDAPAAP